MASRAISAWRISRGELHAPQRVAVPATSLRQSRQKPGILRSASRAADCLST